MVWIKVLVLDSGYVVGFLVSGKVGLQLLLEESSTYLNACVR